MRGTRSASSHRQLMTLPRPTAHTHCATRSCSATQELHGDPHYGGIAALGVHAPPNTAAHEPRVASKTERNRMVDRRSAASTPPLRGQVASIVRLVRSE